MRTAEMPSTPREGRAFATAWPCGSRISGLSMTSTTTRATGTPSLGTQSAVLRAPPSVPGGKRLGDGGISGDDGEHRAEAARNVGDDRRPYAFQQCPAEQHGRAGD